VLLLGGDIAINGGGLNALGGRVELAGLAAPGEVALNVDDNYLSLNIPNDLTRADISLTNEAIVNTSGEGGGEIQVFGRRVMLKEGSQILATTLGSEAGEGITVDASDLVELIGTGFESFEQNFIAGALFGQVRPFPPGTGLLTGTVGVGAAGSITINTGQLMLRDGAILVSPTFGEGAGGTLSVRASESVEAIGSGLITSTLSNATGAAGDIIVNTKQLIVRDGSLVTTITLGEGAGGNIVINASESVEALDTPFMALVSTGIFANSVSGTGAAGGIIIDTGQLIIRGGAQIGSQSGLRFFGILKGGQSGDIVVKASQLIELNGISIDGRFGSGLFTTNQGVGSGGTGGDIVVTGHTLKAINGGLIATTTFGSDNARDIIVKVQESVLLSDTESGLFADTELNSSGNGGSIFINNPKTIQIDDANIAVDSQGIGEGGNIEIRGDSLTLDNQANLLAETASNTGGNITLLLDDLLLMRRDSRISTTAGTIGANGNGGNISIDADLITSIPNENSDITANAFFGQGGRITIASQGIFGIEERRAIDGNRTNDIDASSQFGAPGEVQLNVSLDPARGLVQLPGELVDVSRLVEQNLCQASQGSSFTVTGRGGLPTPPHEPLQAEATWEDWRIASESEFTTNTTGEAGAVETPHGASGGAGEGRTHQQTQDSKPKQIIEAQGWYTDANGTVVLTAYPTTVTPHGTWLNSTNCQ
jgi:large exoprotein involved in heme utilization and adhesion